MDITLIRYGELALKSQPVRSRFENTLSSNIRAGLKLVDIDYKVKKYFGRLFIEGHDKKIEPVLKRVFGIVSFSHCKKIITDIEEIKKVSLQLAKNIKKVSSFAVRCNRIGKHNFGSQDVERTVGAEIVEKFGLRVNLTKPDKTIGVEIRDKDAYIFSDVVSCFGGLPIGTAGKVACVINDFNGAMAAWLFMKRGCRIVAFIKSKSSEKYLRILQNWYIGYDLKSYYLKNTSIERLVEETKSEALITGETLENFKQTKLDIPVFRPLVGFDKKYLAKMKRVIETN